MKVKIFLVLLLAAGLSALRMGAFKTGRDRAIQPVDNNEPNGKIKLHISNSGYDLDLDDLINNPDPRVCDEIYVQSRPIEDMRRIFNTYGKDVTKLDISNWNHLKYNAQDLLDAINMLTNLESLKFSWHKDEFEGEPVGAFNLPKLTKIILEDNSGSDKKIVLNFLMKVLPENSLTALEIEDDENYGKFLEKQKNIKKLSFKGLNPVFSEAFNNLKLDSLTCIVDSTSSVDKEKFPERRKFLKAVLKAQPDVKHLELVRGSDFLHELVDDEVFEEIKKLTKLESLVMSVDALSNLEGLQNLQNLKEIELKTNRRSTVELYDQFSKFKMTALERLTLNLFYFDISEETYTEMSKNLPSLKYLKITLGTRHSVNFFARAFPQIEELSVRFGDSNNFLQFAAAYDGSSKDVQRNLKKIKFYFQGNDLVRADDFAGMLNLFPSLEVLDVGSKFPYSSELFTKIAENLNSLKVLKISSISIDSFEAFPVENSNALKALAAKLKFLSVSFVNERRVLDRNHKYNEKFSYQPLIDEIKDVFRYSEGGMATIHEYKNLAIEAGREE